METNKKYCRDIFSLSNSEMIELVNFFFDDQINLDRLAHYLYGERPSLSGTINYRKIEVLASYYEHAYAVKISFGLPGLDRIVTTGFMLSMEGGPGDEVFYQRDICIGSIKNFYRPFEGVVWEKGMADDFGIEIDFSVFAVYISKQYAFLRDNLKLWNDQLPPEMYLLNPQLKNLYEANGIRNFMVEEIRKPELQEELN